MLEDELRGADGRPLRIGPRARGHRPNRRVILEELSMRTVLLTVIAAIALSLAPSPASAQAYVPGAAAAATRLGVDPQLIDDLVVANRILAHEGILDAYGHVSVRHPTRPNHYLIARSVAPEFVAAD